MRAHIFLFFTMDTAWAPVRGASARRRYLFRVCMRIYYFLILLFLYIFIYGVLCYNLVRENFYKYVSRGWKCYPRMHGGAARKSRKIPPSAHIDRIPRQNRRKSRI